MLTLNQFVERLPSILVYWDVDGLIVFSEYFSFHLRPSCSRRQVLKI
jgi:hypothetical protein